MHSASVCRSYYDSLVSYVEDRGLGQSAMRSAIKWDPNRQLTSEGRLPSHFVKAILDMGEAHCKDALFGLKAGLRAGERTTSLLTFLLLSAPTLERSLYDICRYSSLLVNGINVEINKTYSNEVVFSFKDKKNSEGKSTYIIFMISAWLAMLKRDVDDVLLVEISGPESNDTWNKINSLLNFERYTVTDLYAIRIGFPDIKRAPIYADSEVNSVLLAKADVAIMRLRCDNQFVEKVKSEISETLQSGPLTLECVAKKLQVSARTLQRRLKEKNVCFNEVLDLTRQQYAQDYLLNTSAPLVDVASQLGFASSASFNRAFKRWFRETPNRFRVAEHEFHRKTSAIGGVCEYK